MWNSVETWFDQNGYYFDPKFNQTVIPSENDKENLFLAFTTPAKGTDFVPRLASKKIGFGKTNFYGPFETDLEDEGDVIAAAANYIMHNNPKFTENGLIGNSVIIDGTCACLKSTICSNFNSMKYNEQITNKAINSNAVEILSYLLGSLSYISDYEATNPNSLFVVDRSPANNYQWSYLWPFLTHIFKKNNSGNANALYSQQVNNGDLFDHEDVNYLQRCLSAMSPEVLNFSQGRRTIYIINSNWEQNSGLLAARNQGNDQRRSSKISYFMAQQAMYMYLHNQNKNSILVDLACFTSLSVASGAICHIISNFPIYTFPQYTRKIISVPHLILDEKVSANAKTRHIANKAMSTKPYFANVFTIDNLLPADDESIREDLENVVWLRDPITKRLYKK